MTAVRPVAYGARTMSAPAPAIPAYDSSARVPCWTCDGGRFVLAFSTRIGGVSAPPYHGLNLGRSTADDPAAVAENRRRLLESLDLEPTRLATAGQVHGARSARAETSAIYPDCDGLVTTVPGLAVAVTVADCMPIAYVAPGAVAVAHSGWRGTAAGMPRAALDSVCAAAGVGPDQVHVYLGPSIRSCCYQVGADVFDRFPAAARRRHDRSRHLDLATAARIELARAGVLPEHLVDLAECTACNPARYFSHRRDRGITGRQWAVAALRSA